MYASAQEVLQAIRGLSAEELLRLLKTAQIYLGGTPFTSARDLVFEVYGVAFRAACGDGGRRWRTDVQFMAYLCNTIHGVARDARRKAIRRRETPLCVEADLTGPLQCASPDPEQTLTMQEERQLQEQLDSENLAKVHDHFADDEQVRWVIKGIMEGVPAREIQKLSGMTDTQYETAHRRWRRRLTGLFPGRRSK